MSSLSRARAALALLWPLLIARANGAHAAECVRPDLLDTAPAPGAQAVPTDAVLSAQYTAVAVYDDELVILVVPGGEEWALRPTFDAAERRLSVRPPEPLAPGATYVVRWPALRSLEGGIRGRAADVRFTVGAGPDAEPPRFAGVAAVDWRWRRPINDCTDEIEARYRFTLALTEARDDGGREGLTVVLFQTAGPTVVGAPRPLAAQAMPAVGAAVDVELPVDEAVGRVCFAALVRDLTGKISDGGQREVCVETVSPPFFAGCALGGGRRAGAGALALAAAAAAALALSARRRRR